MRPLNRGGSTWKVYGAREGILKLALQRLVSLPARLGSAACTVRSNRPFPPARRLRGGAIPARYFDASVLRRVAEVGGGKTPSDRTLEVPVGRY